MNSEQKEFAAQERDRKIARDRLIYWAVIAGMLVVFAVFTSTKEVAGV